MLCTMPLTAATTVYSAKNLTIAKQAYISSDGSYIGIQAKVNSTGWSGWDTDFWAASVYSTVTGASVVLAVSGDGINATYYNVPPTVDTQISLVCTPIGNETLMLLFDNVTLTLIVKGETYFSQTEAISTPNTVAFNQFNVVVQTEHDDVYDLAIWNSASDTGQYQMLLIFPALAIVAIIIKVVKKV